MLVRRERLLPRGHARSWAVSLLDLLAQLSLWTLLKWVTRLQLVAQPLLALASPSRGRKGG